MKWSNGGGRSSVSRLALLCAAFLCFSFSTAAAQNSTPILQPLDNPFAQPLLLSTVLLSKIDSLVSSTQALLPKIGALQTLSDEQAAQISLLSKAIADSQGSSSRLQALLEQSEETRVMQGKLLSNSTTSLLDSQKSLTKASIDAKGLELENSLLKIGCISLGLAATGVAIYIVGHALGAWR